MGRSLKGKIGYVDNRDLNISKQGGHYVVIREKRGSKADVSIITSLGTIEHRKQRINISSEKEKRLYRVAKGDYVPIPSRETNLTQWSAIQKEKKTVPLSSIKNIGFRWIKRRNLFNLGKK